MVVRHLMPLMEKRNVDRSKVGTKLKSALTRARMERRLVCGLIPAIKYLEATPEEVVLCVLSRPEDSATHIQATLLQAFCYENDIPVLQVDCSQKLSTYSGQKKATPHCNCALITRNQRLPITDENELPMTAGEQFLANFYECTLGEFPRPIVQLPV